MARCPFHRRRLLFSDECNGPADSRPDPTKWDVESGRLGGSEELQNYTTDVKNAHYNGLGQLELVAYREASGDAQFSSGRLYAGDHFRFTFGRIEARIKVPAGQGLFPAFWSIGDYARLGWPECGEIDVAEWVNDACQVHGSIHLPGDESIYSSPVQWSLAADYHVYAAEWSRSAVTWYLDGIRFARYDVTSPVLQGGISHSPVLNLAIGGGWAGAPDCTTLFPARMLIDWVRVYG